MSQPHSRLAMWDKVKERGEHLFNVTLDTLFLLLWIAVQYYAQRYVEGKHLEPADQGTALVARIVFGFVTIAPFLIWAGRDLAIMFIRAVKEVNYAR